MAATFGNFPDALDARFADVFDGAYEQIPDMVGTFFKMVGPGDTPQKQDYRMSSVGAFGNVPTFGGSITYDDVYEGYDVTVTPIEYASGFQIQRRLFDDDLTGIMEGKPEGLGDAVARTRQIHGAQFFNNAFIVDTTWTNNTENVAVCSNSHTTRATGVSTTAGFDNLITTALNTVALVAARIQFTDFRDDRGNYMQGNPDTLLVPVDLCQQAFEITESMGVPEDATNAANYNRQRYSVKEWRYLSDTNNYFLLDSRAMKRMLVWYQRLSYEFAMVEDFDTLVGKWRVYLRHGQGHRDWRWLLGAQVS